VVNGQVYQKYTVYVDQLTITDLAENELARNVV